MLKNIHTLEDGQENNGVWEAVFFFFFWHNSPLGVHLGGMTCICLQETIKNDKDCTLLTASAEVHFLTLCLERPLTSEENFDLSLFSH